MMKNIERHKRNVDILINMMTDDTPIHEFNILKHSTIASIDKSTKKKRASKKKHAPTRIDMEF